MLPYQLTDEFYDFVWDDDFEFEIPDSFTSEEKSVITSCLTVLYDLFSKWSYYPPQRVLDEIDETIGNFYDRLSETSLEKVEEFLDKKFVSELDDWSIPKDNGYVTLDTLFTTILSLSLIGLTNSLCDEIKLKATYHINISTKDSFNISPNFKRASKKLVDAIGDALLKGSEKNHRNILDFVYGSDKLYRWLCVNDDKTCDWCKYQQSLAPRPLSEIPYDHNHGRCELEPIDDSYSERYQSLINQEAYL